MTEAEWQGSDDLDRMLDYLGATASDRKLRLFAVACCRSVEGLLVDDRSWGALLSADRLADGQSSKPEMDYAEAQAWAAWQAASSASWAARMVWEAVQDQFANPTAWAIWALWATSQAEAPARAAPLLREVIGPLPLREVRIEPAWLAWNDSTVRRLAEVIYEERRFEDLPILADALEDSGCGDEGILSHCRGPGPHVRGCWVVDLIMGKM